MGATPRNGLMRIGEVAARAGASTDTVRYYERLGLLDTPRRAESGYRLFDAVDLGRLRFIRRAKQMGLSLAEIRRLLTLAAEGECGPLRDEVAEMIQRKIVECESRISELQEFKASLEERRRLAVLQQGEPACECAAFPATCCCLPVSLEELVAK